MHNFNTLPTTKRNVLVSSAYVAGTTVVDFTDLDPIPFEVGHHDPHGATLAVRVLVQRPHLHQTTAVAAWT